MDFCGKTTCLVNFLRGFTPSLRKEEVTTVLNILSFSFLRPFALYAGNHVRQSVSFFLFIIINSIIGRREKESRLLLFREKNALLFFFQK